MHTQVRTTFLGYTSSLYGARGFMHAGWGQSKGRANSWEPGKSLTRFNKLCSYSRNGTQNTNNSLRSFREQENIMKNLSQEKLSIAEWKRKPSSSLEISLPLVYAVTQRHVTHILGESFQEEEEGSLFSFVPAFPILRSGLPPSFPALCNHVWNLCQLKGGEEVNLWRILFSLLNIACLQSCSFYSLKKNWFSNRQQHKSREKDEF